MTKKTPVKKAAKRAVKTPAKPNPKLEPIAQVAKDVAAAPTLPPDDPERRRLACVAEIDAVLEKYGCCIRSAINPIEAVGGEPTSKIMVSSTWGIMPFALKT